MPEIRMIDLERQLKADKPSRVYLVCGNEDHLKRKAVQMLLDRCKPEILPEFNYERIDGEKCSVRDIENAVEQLPQMSRRRCVLIENLAAAILSGDSLERLCECIGKSPADCVLIIWQYSQEGASAVGFRKVTAACQKAGSVLKLNTPQRGELADMLCDRAKEISAKLKREDAVYLVDRYGSDLSGLMGELDKLSAYAGKKVIDRAMIDLLCPQSLEANVFHISQNILRGNRDEAFRLVENLLAQRTDPIEIYACVVGNFVDLYRAKAAVSANISAAEMIKAFPGEYDGKRDFKIKNAMRDCSGYSIALLRRYLDLLMDTEMKLKGSKADNKICLEQLISRLCLAKSEALR